MSDHKKAALIAAFIWIDISEISLSARHQSLLLA